jgi:hypothetical protein
MVAALVIPLDRKYFRDKTGAGPALNLNDDIQCIGDVCLNGAIWYFDATL